MSLMSSGYNYDQDKDLTPLNCYCEGYCPAGQEYGTCQTLPGGKCFTAVEVDIDEWGEEYPLLSYGCLPPHEMALFQCRATLLAIRESKTIKCCDEYDNCNKHMLPVIPQKALKPEDDPHFNTISMKILISSISVSLIMLSIILAIAFLKYRKKKVSERSTTDESPNEPPTINISNVSNIINFTTEATNASTANISLDLVSTASGNTSGLVQRTAGKQVTKSVLIAKGKYSEVWKANWRTETVTVKIFNKGEQIFLRDIDIYQTVLLRDDNILGFIAADIRAKEISNEMLLITEYCEFSLHQYLKANIIDITTLLKMSKDIVTGLELLQAEVIGVRGKPAVAHNNLHSNNILIKKNMVCCLGDFGKSVKFFSSPKHKLDLPGDTQNSQIRYLAPEILDETFDKNNFESYKMSDMYALSLIMWELLNRCKTNEINKVESYQKPFEKELGNNDEQITIEIVKIVVADKKLRPKLKETWKKNETLKIYCKLIKETWNDASTRLTCLRVKKNINVLLKNLEEDICVKIESPEIKSQD